MRLRNPLVRVDQLACAVTKALGVQLFVSDHPGELARTCEQLAAHRHRALPLLAKCWQSPHEPIFWAKAVHAGKVLGLAAARVARGHEPGQPLADALAAGLLYRTDTVLAGRNWVQGAGPELPAPGKAVYLGLEWAAPQWMGCGLPEALTRTVLLAVLQEAPDVSLVWSLEELDGQTPGAVNRLVAPERPRDEKVFSGFYPPLGRSQAMRATWCGRAEVDALLQRDANHLGEGQPLPWLKEPPVPLRGKRG